MKRVKLTQGKYALVDDEDYPLISQYKWYFIKTGYARTSIWIEKKNTKLYMHRLILNTPKGLETDHLNHNKLDNRKSNLRIVTKSQNGMNRVAKGGKYTKYKGVTKNRYGTWQAQILHQSINSFPSDHLAAMAYDLWARDLFGEFALTNFRAPDNH